MNKFFVYEEVRKELYTSTHATNQASTGLSSFKNGQGARYCT